jgi:hypothetical protein
MKDEVVRNLLEASPETISFTYASVDEQPTALQHRRTCRHMIRTCIYYRLP